MILTIGASDKSLPRLFILLALNEMNCIGKQIMYLSLLNFSGAVKSHVSIAVVVEECFQHVQHARHLCEDQCAVVPAL